MRHRPPDIRKLLAPSVLIGEQMLTGIFELEPDDQAFHRRAKVFAPLIQSLAKAFATTYEARHVIDGRAEADALLLQTHERWQNLPVPHKATADDIDALQALRPRQPANRPCRDR